MMTPPWTVESNILAAGMLPISTVALPLMIVSGGPTQVTMSLSRAAGMLRDRAAGGARRAAARDGDG